MNGSWDAYLASPADFAGADDCITNLVKETEPGIEIAEHTPNLLLLLVLQIKITLVLGRSMTRSSDVQRLIAPILVS